MKVWIVYEWLDCDLQPIRGVFDKQQKAAKFKKKMWREQCKDAGYNVNKEKFEIEEWEVK